MRPVNGIVLAVDFPGSFHIVSSAVVIRAESADIERPDIQARLTLYDPFRHHPSRAPARSNAESVKPHRDKAVFQLRGWAHNGVAIRRESFRTIYQPGDAGIFQARGTLHSRNRE